ncbi:MAG: hypothetical protein OES79_13385, partial [Planctomycetota bacterium]|nr:hypothetical protein [Planctomycetota bacterium]
RLVNITDGWWPVEMALSTIIPSGCEISTVVGLAPARNRRCSFRSTATTIFASQKTTEADSVASREDFFNFGREKGEM